MRKIFHEELKKFFRKLLLIKLILISQRSKIQKQIVKPPFPLNSRTSFFIRCMPPIFQESDREEFLHKPNL